MATHKHSFTQLSICYICKTCCRRKVTYNSILANHGTSNMNKVTYDGAPANR